MKLGLIGQHIQKSRSPELQQWLGQHNQHPTTYELFDCELANESALLDLLLELKAQGYQGVNVTHPYKVWAWNIIKKTVRTDKTLGALNTVLLNQEQLIGINTDCTGFKRAYQDHFGQNAPKKVLLKGAGGVGRAIAFGLAQLKVEHIYIFDSYTQSQQALIADLQAVGVSATGIDESQIIETSKECEGLVNATPVGHYATPGASYSDDEIFSPKWIFDAVYTPVETEFIQLVKKKQAEVISGYELFINQGIDAFEMFIGHEVDTSGIYDAIPITG
ncbi:MAG: shikimate dehydrogenase family protein [Vibrio sp.]